MSSGNWHPWENSSTKTELKVENQDKGFKRSATIFKSIPQKDGGVTETTKALHLPKRAIEKVFERGKLNKRKKKNQKKTQFSKINEYWRNLIR